MSRSAMYGIKLTRRATKERVSMHDVPGKLTIYSDKEAAIRDIKKYFSSKEVKKVWLHVRPVQLRGIINP